MDRLDGLKQWKCRNGHVLGVVRREAVSANGSTYYVTRLIKYRHAVDLMADQPIDVDVDCSIEGTVHDLVCDIPGCGQTRTWWMGDAAMERLLERMKARNMDVDNVAILG